MATVIVPVAVTVLGLVLAAGGSAAGTPTQVGAKPPPGGFKLPLIAPIRTSQGVAPTKIVPASPSNHPLILHLTGTVSCGTTRTGTATTCQVLATMVAPHLGTLTYVPLATFSKTLKTGASMKVAFALSQHSVNLLYQHGDPRCTVVLAIVADGGPTVAKTYDQVPISFKTAPLARRARG